MAITKTKIDLIDNNNSLKVEMDNYYNCYSYWDDDYDYSDHSYNCRCDYCDYREPYSYIDSPNDYLKLISKRSKVPRFSGGIMGKMIDMSSIYSKEMKREKKIDEILGLSMPNFSSTTIGDYIK